MLLLEVAGRTFLLCREPREKIALPGDSMMTILQRRERMHAVDTRVARSYRCLFCFTRDLCGPIM